MTSAGNPLRPGTLLMIEAFTKDHPGEFSKKTLYENIPGKISYQMFSFTIDYLQDTGKIAVDIEGKICWVHNPELVKCCMRDQSLKIR
jgi:hypothetical protein